MGIPIGLAYGLEAAVASLSAVLIGHFGALALAASNVVHQLTKIVYQINLGLSHGSSIMASRALGRGQYREIGVIAKAALLIGWLPMVTSAWKSAPRDLVVCEQDAQRFMYCWLSSMRRLAGSVHRAGSLGQASLVAGRQ